MKAVIQRTNDLKNYIVITDDGQEFIVKTIDEAIELKNKLIKSFQFSLEYIHVFQLHINIKLVKRY